MKILNVSQRTHNESSWRNLEEGTQTKGHALLLQLARQYTHTHTLTRSLYCIVVVHVATENVIKIIYKLTNTCKGDAHNWLSDVQCVGTPWRMSDWQLAFIPEAPAFAWIFSRERVSRYRTTEWHTHTHI